MRPTTSRCDRGYLKYIKRYHMAHHFKAPDALYGVTARRWDRAFRTGEA